MHDSRFRRFHAQRQSRQGVRDQVGPEDLDGGQGTPKPGQDGHDDGQEFADVAGEEVLDGLQHIGVDGPPFPDGGHDRDEIVVHDDHVGRFLGHVRAGDPHGGTDVGAFERRRIVYAVAGHRHDVPAGLRAPTMRSLCSGATLAKTVVVATASASCSSFISSNSSPLKTRSPAAPNLQLFRDGGRRGLMIAGDHDGLDARASALVDGLARLGAGRVDHAHQTDERQFALEFLV